ncbi:carboxymethylenebutenolidase, partial [Pseudomassariella vexata]
MAHPLPSAKPERLTPTLTIHAPLSRHGNGPGIVIVTLRNSARETCHNETLDPEPLQKWAEEGFTVARLELAEGTSNLRIRDELGEATEALTMHEKCTNQSAYGLIVHFTTAFPELTEAIDGNGEIKAVVSFGALPAPCAKPHLYHLAEKGSKSTAENEIIYRYPEAKSPAFVLPDHPDFAPASAAVAHSRCLEFVKKHLGGPWFDLEAIWEEHTFFEFGERSVEKTMATMVQEPYVNHITTITGGIGREKLSAFYRDHFVFNNPEDTELQLVSRTVGIDRVVDEFVFCLTHTKMVDWLAPGVPPTGKPLRIPMTAIVNIRGDRLYHEHISWDQVTVLLQLGLMPEYLHFPYALEDGRKPAAGKKF